MTHWVSAVTFRRPRGLMLALAVSTSVAGVYVLFAHLMQTSAPFAEAVAKVSPTLANTFSCTCPFCAAACQPPASQQGLNRFDAGFPDF